MRRLERAALLGGLLFPILAITGLVLAGPAMPSDFSAAPAEVAAHLAAHPPTTITWVGLSLEVAGLLALLAFGTRVSASASEEWHGRAVHGLILAAVTVKLASVAPVLVALHVSNDLSGEAQALLFRLNDAAVPVSDIFMGCFALAAGALLVSCHQPAWLGAFGAVAGACTLIDLFLATGWLSLPLVLWLMTCSVVLLVRTRSTSGGKTPILVKGADR